MKGLAEGILFARLKEAHSLLDKIAREKDFNYFNLSTKTGTKLQLTAPLKYQGQLKAAHQLWPQ